MKVIFTYDKNTIESDFTIADYQLKEIYYNNLQQADNSVSLAIPFNVEIQNFINAYADKNIKAQIIDNDETVFTGYVRKNFDFSKRQCNLALKLEIVSPSYLLDVETEDLTVITSTNLGLAVKKLLSKAGFTTNIELTEEIGLFKVDAEKNIKSTLTELLFEYGYGYDFDNNGNFIVYPLFNIPDKSTITQTFDGSNCREEIKVNKKEQNQNGTNVKWDQVELVTNKLIFADTTGGTTDKPTNCSIELPAKSYLGEIEDTKSYYITYDCAEGEVRYCTKGTLTIESTNNSGLVYSYKNLGDRGELSVYNNTSKTITITKIIVNGDAYVVKSTNQSKSNTGKKYKELNAEFIHTSKYAEQLCKNYSNWLNYANYTVTLKSYTDYALGTFVKVSEKGLGTIYGRIIEKVSNIKKEAINYKIEAISNYELATVSNKSTKQSAFIFNGLAGKDGVDGKDGIDGKNGVDGKDGISPTITATKSGSTTTITIKDANGTTTATINDGANGTSLTNKGNWATSTAYKINEYVYYTTNKTSYVCKKAHTSSSSILPTNTTYWSVLATSGSDGKNGVDGKNGTDGKNATQYYIHYVYCDNTSTGANYSTSESKTYIGTYTDTTQADASTFAIANAKAGIVWSKITGTDGKNGVDGKDGINGKDGVDGKNGIDGKNGTNGVSMRNKGTWASGTAYVNNSSYIDVVYYATNGCSYSCIKSHTASSSILPTNTTYWSLLASKGDKGDKGNTGSSGSQGVRGAQYKGAYSSAPTTSIVSGDWYLNTGDGYCYYYSGSSWTKITSYSDYRYQQAMADIISLSATLTSNENLKILANTWVENLIAGTAIIEKLFAKQIKLGADGSLQSNDFNSWKYGYTASRGSTVAEVQNEHWESKFGYNTVVNDEAGFGLNKEGLSTLRLNSQSVYSKNGYFTKLNATEITPQRLVLPSWQNYNFEDGAIWVE